MSNQNSIHKEADIVLVDLDDESYRLIPWTYPYPRGEVWAKVINNLSLAGAKVIVFDLSLDAPDQNSSLLNCPEEILFDTNCMQGLLYLRLRDVSQN